MHDPLETILAPPPSMPPPGWVYPTTVAALRRARRWQRARRFAALAAGAAALVALTALVPTGGPRAPDGPPAAEAAREAPTAQAMEWRALEGPGPPAPAYVKAGDRYLDAGDPESAVRCYGHAVSAGATTDISESDSYLLMAIKLARKKESE